MYGNDLSSLSNMLNLGLCFFIKLASNRRASLSFEVVVVSKYLVKESILSVLIGKLLSDT